MTRPPLLVIVGPTGVGKTAVAVRLAATLPLEAVNADSRQVYRGMDIGTGKPTVEERARLRHHLIDVVDPDERYHVARFRAEALRAFGERTGVQEVMAVVGAFVQAEKLGTPLGKTLRIHADAARVRRRHRAEEQAHLAPLKMIFPTVFFLFPSYILVTMAPSVLSVMRMLSSMRSH